ncbi:GAJ protein, putative [Talaromyces stipitatus ATCC 10500]|uniref:GAJ protein, putative n=1 Tax=Talaromyces stipitatus (strain ATCC 10500 / CBS 375.48 / QM 6759 / NRRL 1006) TaxID=441959 RepID=B8MEB0_TALSN|nr:GAJ protein, putative [Talaromyces stipitatus ATCC 10500]EED16537.1 GAJ protein, putative [Talaromyces stipitatus ATCC 10500]
MPPSSIQIKHSQARGLSTTQSSEESRDEEPRNPRRRRRITVYDIVAGRVNRQRFISHSYTSRFRRNVSSSRAVRPSNDIVSRLEGDEALDDWIDENSLDGVPLPSSDMLEAIQSYAGHFYANTVDSRRTEHFSSMDGTALIAMGVLLEEMTEELLGQTGDMVLVEREDDSNDDLGYYASEASISSVHTGRVSRKRSASVMSRGTSKHTSGTEDDSSSSRKSGKNKRPRLDKSVRERSSQVTRESFAVARHGSWAAPSCVAPEPSNFTKDRAPVLNISSTQSLVTNDEWNLLKQISAIDGRVVLYSISETMASLHAPRSKAISSEVKQQMILNHIRSTRTCHTLKDLEKMLPSVASINSIQVKDFIIGLVNENKIRVEKVGSNNWYWSFPSDERRARENLEERLLRDLNRLTKLVEQLEDELQKKQTAAKEEEGSREPIDIETERRALMERKSKMSSEIERLQDQKNAFENNGVSKLKQKTEEIKKWKLETEIWEDNISIMEQYLCKLAGGDRGLVEAIKKQCYGDNYEDDHEISESGC